MATVSFVNAEPGPESGLLGREDIVLEDGVMHLVHETVTPSEARVSDLLLIAAALEAAGVQILLVRHHPLIPALAVDIADRYAAFDALAGLCADEPLYLKMRHRPPMLAAGASAPQEQPTRIRAYRPRITPNRALRYGPSLGVRIEFWQLRDALVETPDENALTRRMIARDDLTFTTVNRFGRQWRTIAGMWDPHPHEFTEDVDMVFSWVDGSRTEFQRRRAAQLSQYVVGEGDDGPARYRHVDELRYALRSVHMYAPWVRKIFIATDSPAPAWLRPHPKITIVRSEEFFADPGVLPTHNSHAVESQLHRIPGLAEHFLYSNDDMFFGRPVDPNLFFTPAGVTKFVESTVRIGSGAPNLQRSGHDNGLRVNRALLQERFGRTIVRDLEHCATPLRRSIMAELEREFPDEFARTAAARFRSATDVSVTNSLYHYYALMTGRAVATARPRVRYVHTTMKSALRRMARLVERTDIDMFCLNDGAESELSESVRAEAVRSTLQQLFPIVPPWEDIAVSEPVAPARAVLQSPLR